MAEIRIEALTKEFPGGVVAVKDLEGGYQELARIIHPHPTISEAIPEAARAVDKWAFHA